MYLLRLVLICTLSFLALSTTRAYAISENDIKSQYNNNIDKQDTRKYDSNNKSSSIDDNIQRAKAGAKEFSLMVDSLTKDNVDYFEAFLYAKDAAYKNFCCAFGYLGTFYMHGLGIKQNLDEAYKAFIKGYKCNDLQSIYGLSQLYSKGFINPKGKGGKEKEILYLELAASKEYVPAQYDLAVILLDDDPKSIKGINLLKQAANGRYGPAIRLYYEKYATRSNEK